MQRMVGLCGPKGGSSMRMLEITKALAKLQPEPHLSPPPIIAGHMLFMRRQCGLEDSDVTVVIWAISNTCWADIKGLRDIFSSPEEVARGWNPDFSLHRERIEILANLRGRHDIVVIRNPSKADPTGMYRYKFCLSTGPDSKLLHPANALKCLFLREGDPSGTAMAQQPVSRDPATKEEIAKIQFRRCLSNNFAAA